MISGTIGESRKFAALANDTHRMIYLMVIPHVDKAGRFEADPIVIRSKCLMRLNVDLSLIQAWLNDAASIGLIHFYEANGIPILEIVDFLKHNTPHHKEPESELPGPDQGTPFQTQETNVESSMKQACAKHESTSAIIEVNRIELKEKEREYKTPSTRERESPPEQLAASPPREKELHPSKEKELYQLYVDAWNEHRGPLPAIRGLNPQRRRAIDAHVKEHGEAAFLIFIDAVRQVATESFWIERGYGFGNILTAGKALNWAEKWRETGGRDLSTSEAKAAKDATNLLSHMEGRSNRR